MDAAVFEALARAARESAGLAAKAEIGAVAERLGLHGAAVPVGDDCAAIPDGDGWLLFAIEGFINGFVAADPWFAGWCGIMVNLSDIAAMGGRPIAVVDAIWADGEPAAAAILDGMKAASEAYGTPIVGGHSNLRTSQAQLAVAVLGRAGPRLLTSFDARPGDALVAAIDHRGAYREPFDNWQAALQAPGARLRADLALLPEIAEQGLRAGREGHQPGRHSGNGDHARREFGRRHRHRPRRHRAAARRFARALAEDLSELRLPPVDGASAMRTR